MTDNFKDPSLDQMVFMYQILQNRYYKKISEHCGWITNYLITKFYFIENYTKLDRFQEAKLILLTSIISYDPKKGQTFEQYYYRSLRNHFSNLVRRGKTQKRMINHEAMSLDYLIDVAGQNIVGESSSVSEPEGATMAKEIYEKFLQDLSSFEQNVFLMHTDGKSFEEIAKTLNYNVNQVKNAYYRSQVKLENKID